ncbi:MAG: DNA primase, partial [Paracoccaceae bacterium]
EPLIALDGDTAGLRAAMRLIDLALPLLEAGQSLRFVILPDGKDPDDLIRSEGKSAVQKLLDNALPMVRLLWQRETEGRVFDSPERKAALDKSLREKIKLIRDPSIRGHYGQEIKNLRWELFTPKRTAKRAKWTPGKKAPEPAMPGTKASVLAAGSSAEDNLRVAVILASIIATPEIIGEFESGLERMTCRDPRHARLRDVVLRHSTGEPGALGDKISDILGPETLENLHALGHVAISPCVRDPGNLELARMTLNDELAKLETRYGLIAEIADAAEDLTGVADEAVTWRLGQAAEARNKAERSEHEDTAEYDIADSGARISRDERNALDDLLEQINSAKQQR